MKFQKRMMAQFIYWMNERQSIWLKRKTGDPWPWTKDKILQEYKFTNVYRQNDRVTMEWTDRFVRLLHRGKYMDDGMLLFHCVMFRIFNWPPTYDALYFGITGRHPWNLNQAIEILRKRKEEDFEKIFTGAYIITGAGRTDPKHEVICEALDLIWMFKEDIAKEIVKNRSMEKAVDELAKYPTIGRFVAYEMACDLRFTRLLAPSLDMLSWANPGPGAKRGIHRLLTGRKEKVSGVDYVKAMRQLYVEITSSGKLIAGMKCEWPFELREIEHSLCEFDKYQRLKNKEGSVRSRYHYKEPRDEAIRSDD